MTIRKTDNIYGNYAPLAEVYTKVRRGYPPDVFEWCHKVVSGEQPLVLDLGCGTGISTRQLAESGFRVIGSDVAEPMVATAKASSENIEYVVAPAENLPFADNYFDGATAFTSFHWFETLEALAEICRVLKPGGAFCVIHRKGVDEFTKDYRKIVEQFVGKSLPSVYGDFDPERTLRNSQFVNVQAEQLELEEPRTLDEYINYFESTSLWNYLSEQDKPKAKQALHEHYSNIFPNRTVLRKIQITLVAGFKSI